ncbi:hypothetical protein GW7_04324 [Heterocephalus glaber]|uniref:Uncharacterized protein C14orf105 homolog isoform X3 n=1 Tax=Heterocephalus glaber TaxID=10181 RepID=G5ANI2_HETGA|nr:uncharacterized protein C14orf105 homolog isoform X3 [Heterocephalus glaber]XP_021104880.1 uncharacterized protein C14orf105 homolog isoform X3 [Heterocephalus glaber]EHA98592.1 hypothetical protein GW7_04324 [Heterocephalus glaber]
MGLSYAKAHPGVTKVAPFQSKEAETPSAGPLNFAVHQNLEENNLYLFTRLQDQNRALEGQLPPLRENWYGRYSAAPRDMYFDIPLEPGETSIIKRHPPQRLQKLQPIDLPQVRTSERLPSQQAARMRPRAKQELEKKMQTPMYTSGKRQYLHKMQMLEMNRKRQEAQMELKKSLHREAKINEQKPRDHKAKKTLQSVPRNDDYDIVTMLPEETMNRGPGNSQDAEFLQYQARNYYCPWKMGKMETWFHEQEARGQLLWDSSSSDSELGRDEKKPQPLVRTRTERIPLFDEFLDQE